MGDEQDRPAGASVRARLMIDLGSFGRWLSFELTIEGTERVAVEFDADSDNGVSILAVVAAFISIKRVFGREVSFFETIIQSIYKMLYLQ
jgi:hypothetical protein